MTARRRWIAAACLLLAPPVLATAADKPTDCFGDPLPDGVAARMGTVRFRHGGDVEFVGYLPDGKTILSFGKDDTVRWWDAESGKELRRRSAPRGWDARRRRRIGGCWRRRWETTSCCGTRLRARSCGGWRRPDARLGGIAFSPDRRLVATCGNHIRLWDATTGERVRDLGTADETYPAKVFVSGVPYTAAAFLPDAKTVVSTGTEGVLWWDAETDKAPPASRGAQGPGVCVAVSPDGKRAATAGADHALRLWDAEKKTEIGSIVFSRPARSGRRSASLAFAPDGKVLAVGCGDGAIVLYAAADGALLRRFEAHQARFPRWPFLPTAPSSSPAAPTAPSASGTWPPARKSAPSPDRPARFGRWPCRRTARPSPRPGVDRRIHLWDATSGEERRSLEGSDEETIALLGFSPDGRTLTSVAHGGAETVAVWDAAGGKRRSVFSLAEKHYPNALALSPDAGAGGGVRPAGRRPICRFRRGQGGIAVQASGGRPAAAVAARRLPRRQDAGGVPPPRRPGHEDRLPAPLGRGRRSGRRPGRSRPTSGRSSGPPPRPTAGSSPRPGRAGACGSGTSPRER